MVLLPLFQERGGDHEAERRRGDDAADHPAEAERRELEELRARVALLRLVVRRRRGTLGRRRGAAGVSGATSGACASAVPAVRSRTQRNANTSAITRADAGDPPRDDETDQEHDDADGEADRPQARARDVRVVVVGLGQRLSWDSTGRAAQSGQRRNRRREL